MKIKSPISKEFIFQTKLKRLFEAEQVVGAFIFYIPKAGDVRVFDVGLCGHQLKTLSEMLEEESERRITEDEHEHDRDE